MKKGVVFQLDGGHALLLEKGGRFTRVRAKKGWAVGDVVSTSKQLAGRSIQFWVTQAAGVLLMVLTIQFGVYHYCGQPTTYISVDVNPSVEIGVNRMDKVISAAAYNADGARVLEEVELEGKTYREAVLALMETEGMQPYLEDSSCVMVAVTSKSDRAEELAAALAGLAGQAKALGEDIQYKCNTVEWNLVEEAHKLGTTIGRLSLFEEFEAQYDAASWEEFLESPLSSIIELLAGEEA